MDNLLKIYLKQYNLLYVSLSPLLPPPLMALQWTVVGGASAGQLLR
jgi:hypothetical protein